MIVIGNQDSCQNYTSRNEIDDSSVKNQIVESLTIVIYDQNMFIEYTTLL